MLQTLTAPGDVDSRVSCRIERGPGYRFLGLGLRGDSAGHVVLVLIGHRALAAGSSVNKGIAFWAWA
mgnify:CR=1 FL=1